MPTEAVEKELPLDRGGRERCAAPDGGGGNGQGAPGGFADPATFGLWAFLGTLTMLFIGFSSALVVRRSAADWRPLSAPPLLWLNTAALLASSAALQGARHRLREWDLPAARMWLGATGLLGAVFVVGQLGVWRALREQGIYLVTNPHSSFFYLLTGLHIVHLLGGLIWFAVVLTRLTRGSHAPGQEGLSLFATYWHFLAVLWVYLALLLFVL
jgi:cytochrome c oxidase subunit III